MIVDFDDFGADHIISDMCRTRDCRKELLELKEVNPRFKCTLFAVPDHMTIDLLEWCKERRDWVELAVHGFSHSSNYECEKITYDEFDRKIDNHVRGKILRTYFQNGFKAPGWQISDDALMWLRKNGWWVADQNYNDERRPEGLKNYVIREGTPSHHGHVWNCCGNGIEETLETLKEQFAEVEEFKFVSEVV